ncbi:MAG: hypothetical protein R2747_15355 [Pyrinomonadaceae bacterium]
MAFNPRLLPPTVYDVYKKGPSLWTLTVQTAIEVGITDLNKLTDIAFHQHNPDLMGRSIKTGERNLIEQWQYFQRLIRGMVRSFEGKKAEAELLDAANNYLLDQFTDEIIHRKY